MLLPFLLLWVYLLYITRPGKDALTFQLKEKERLPQWSHQILDSVFFTSPLDKLPGTLDDGFIHDYVLFTHVPRPNKKDQDLFLVGFFCRFIPFRRSSFKLAWSADSDILLAISLHALSLFIIQFFPTLAFPLFRFNPLTRPWSIFLTPFSAPSLFSCFQNFFLLINVGQAVRNVLPNSMTFWLLYSLIPAWATFVNSKVLEHFPQTTGGFGGMMALLVYGSMKIPRSKFLLFGQMKLGCFGLFVFHLVQYLSIHPRRHVVSLMFDVFIITVLTVFLYRVQHPLEEFTPKKIYDLTINTVYL